MSKASKFCSCSSRCIKKNFSIRNSWINIISMGSLKYLSIMKLIPSSYLLKLGSWWRKYWSQPLKVKNHRTRLSLRTLSTLLWVINRIIGRSMRISIYKTKKSLFSIVKQFFTYLTYYRVTSSNRLYPRVHVTGR